METQKLRDYIRGQLERGVDKETIKNSLVSAFDSLQEEDILTAFEEVEREFGATPTKKKKWAKILLVLVGILILLITVVIFLPHILNLFVKDIPQIDDSDIRLKKVSIPDSKNAYFDLVKLGDVIYEPEGKRDLIIDMAAGKAWDDVAAEEVVIGNTEAFRYFRDAAAKSKFQDPAVSDPAHISPNLILPPMNSWREMARVSAIRAAHLANQGKDKEAMEEALLSVKIGQKIQESQAMLIEYLVASAMKSTGLEATQRIVSSSKLSSAELVAYARALDLFYENEEGLADSFKAEYHMQSWTVDEVAKANEEVLRGVIGERKNIKVKNNYYFHPNKTKQIFAEYARENIKDANKPCGEIKDVKVHDLLPQGNPIKLYVEENLVGKIMHDVLAVRFTGASIRKCEEDLLVAATESLIAIKAYKNDHGEYPASLNNLSPRYIFSVPVDPFDGSALKYSPAKKILYSVGSDLKDSGGESTGDDWRAMADPTFKINF